MLHETHPAADGRAAYPFGIAVHVSQALRHDTGYSQRLNWVSTQ
jgi:hypothetical protein